MMFQQFPNLKLGLREKSTFPNSSTPPSNLVQFARARYLTLKISIFDSPSSEIPENPPFNRPSAQKSQILEILENLVSRCLSASSISTVLPPSFFSPAEAATPHRQRELAIETEQFRSVGKPGSRNCVADCAG